MWALWTALAWAGLSVEAPSPEPVRPGSTEVLAWSVVAEGPVRGIDTLVLPDGWSVALPSEPIALAGPGRATQLVGVRIPATAPAGEHAITYELRDPSGHLLVEASTTVIVEQVTGLSLRLEGSGPLVRAGDEVTWQAFVENTGNHPLTVEVEPTCRPPLECTLPHETLALAPGTPHTIALTLSVPRSARSGNLRAGLTVTPTEARSLQRRKTLALEILGGKAPRRTRHTARGELRLQGGYERGGPVLRLASEGLVPLARASVAYDLAVPVLGELRSPRSPVRLKLTTPQGTLALADQRAGLSQLPGDLLLGTGLDLGFGSDALGLRAAHVWAPRDGGPAETLVRLDAAREEWGSGTLGLVLRHGDVPQLLLGGGGSLRLGAQEITGEVLLDVRDRDAVSWSLQLQGRLSATWRYRLAHRLLAHQRAGRVQRSSELWLSRRSTREHLEVFAGHRTGRGGSHRVTHGARLRSQRGDWTLRAQATGQHGIGDAPSHRGDLFLDATWSRGRFGVETRLQADVLTRVAK